MTSERKIEANRKNAKRSTGPRTSLGKVRVRHNALRHGLAVSVASLPELSAEAERLSRLIMGDDDNLTRLHYARIAAEAEIEILRVRKVRTQIISLSALGTADPDHATTIQSVSEVLLQLARFDRYEQRALSRRRRAIRELGSL